MSAAPPPAPAEDFSKIEGVDYDRLPDCGWEPPGPVAFDFLQSDAFVRAIMGPYGSAKTSTMDHDVMLKARSQPIAKDGFRYHTACVIADTYAHLYANTIRTWHEWFPADLGKWKGSQDRPARHDIVVRDQYGLIRLSVDFMAMGEHSAEDALDGFEPGQAVLDGASRLNEDVLDYLTGRVKRGMSMKLLGPEAFALKWNGITLGFNPPDMDHWLYRRFVEQRPENFRFFAQPGGRDPGAENLANLAADYYEAMVAANAHNPAFVARMVDNKWGFAEDGQPVYPAFSERNRALRKLPYIKGRPLYLGLDGGQTLHPAAVFAQRDDEGQWRIILEVAPGRIGASGFADLLARVIEERFAGANIIAFCDPTADSGADKERGELSWLDTVTLRLGFTIQPAPSNEIGLRIDAVGQAVNRNLHDGRVGMIIGDECPSLLAGFGGKYCYRRIKVGNSDQYENYPIKLHPWSDVHDALQYIVLGVEGALAVKVGRYGMGDPFAQFRSHAEDQQKDAGPGEYGWSVF